MNEDNEKLSDDIEELVLDIQGKLSWLRTGKAAKYKEEQKTYRDIIRLAQRIIWQCEGHVIK